MNGDNIVINNCLILGDYEGHDLRIRNINMFILLTLAFNAKQ